MDPATMGLIGSIVGPLIGGGMTAIGQASANQANREQALLQMGFQAQMQENQANFGRETMGRQEAFQTQMFEKQSAFANSAAQTQRDYETQMSNTQYQRAMADMKAAGLNPMLAYSQGGAGTPSVGQASTPSAGSGSSASISSPSGSSSTMGNVLSGLAEGIKNSITSSMEYSRMKQSLSLLDEQIAKTKSEKNITEMDEKINKAGLKDNIKTAELTAKRNRKYSEYNSSTAAVIADKLSEYVPLVNQGAKTLKSLRKD